MAIPRLAPVGVELHSVCAPPTFEEPEFIGSEWCAAGSEIMYDDGSKDVSSWRWTVPLCRSCFCQNATRTRSQGTGQTVRHKTDQHLQGGQSQKHLEVLEIQARKKIHEKLDASVAFASMPPAEGVKALISHTSTEQANSEGEHSENNISRREQGKLLRQESTPGLHPCTTRSRRRMLPRATPQNHVRHTTPQLCSKTTWTDHVKETVMKMGSQLCIIGWG